FSRSVAVDNWTDLQIGLQAHATDSTSWAPRLMILAGVAFLFGVALRIRRLFPRRPATGKPV
ncbi:MAG: hypothetical protein V4710_03245, partial [Verrucomicrobiota bacterium]